MADGLIEVTVIYSPAAREMREWRVLLAPGSSVADAIAGSGLLAEYPDIDLDKLGVGVWGRKAARTQLLRERDRVEVYRPLMVDPKVARRERFRAQGSRATGLFAARGRR